MRPVKKKYRHYEMKAFIFLMDNSNFQTNVQYVLIYNAIYNFNLVMPTSLMFKLMHNWALLQLNFDNSWNLKQSVQFLCLSFTN